MNDPHPHPHPLWTSAEATAATNGTCSGNWTARGVSIDTRSIKQGELFVALKGPNFDGHAFVQTALDAGAAAVIVSSEDQKPDEDQGKLLYVKDTMVALESLAKSSRDRMSGNIIAVTGSVGKTSTKEMLKLVLSEQGRVTASFGNLNNHWGLPLSLSRMPRDTAFGVFEMGMNHAGEIEPLSRLARPHVALITTIEAVHTAHFNSVDEIAAAKAEIFAGVVPGGAAVLNRDNPYFEHLSRCAEDRDLEIFGFGYHPDAFAHLKRVNLHEESSQVVLQLDGQSIEYTIGAPGDHLVCNSAGVLAAVHLSGGDVAQAAGCLEAFRSLTGRGGRSFLKVNGHHITLLDESYNASPPSMRAAFDVAARIQPSENGRRIAVLGDMLELGDLAPTAHASLVGPLKDCGFDLVFTCGSDMQVLWDTLPEGMRGGHSISPEKLALVVSSALENGDVVVIKGSLGSRVGTIVEVFQALDQAQPHSVDQVVGA